MSAAFASGVEVIVGCDAPSLTAAYVDQAVAALRNADLVLGPAEDGGYCLIAMRELQQRIFVNIPWSSDAVLSETLNAAKGLAVATLEPLWDVDDGDDLQRWQAMCEASPQRNIPRDSLG